jgi:prepilin-type N-terminal cleavage/methylation domain-containing protein
MKLQKGFTLIELAVVIAIIAILAAVAIPRFADTTSQAELSTIKDLKATLGSAAAIYTAAQSTTPNNFGNFVETAATTAAGQKTISVAKIGPKNQPCAGAGQTLTCSNGYNKWTNVVYTFNGGQITGTATPVNGNSLPAASF